MKALIALMVLSLAGCETLPIKGKVCYNRDGNEVCAESDGTSILISGNVNAEAKAK